MNSLRHLFQSKWAQLFAGLGLLSIGFTTRVNAQSSQVPMVAFVASKPFTTNPFLDDRSAIYFVDAAGNLTVDTIFVGAAAAVAHASHLSVLAATSDGKSLVVGGHFTFPDPKFNQPDSMDAIIKLDAPFTISNINSLTSTTLPTNPVVVLKVINLQSVNRSIPTAVVTQDNKNWYATWTASQPGQPQLWFYHGSMTGNDYRGTATIDSIEYGAGNNGQGIEGGFHMTNLAASPDGSMMIAVVVDNLSNSTNGAKFHAINWNPHGAVVSQKFSSRDFSNAVISKFSSSTATIDYNMGFGIRSEQDGTTADFMMDQGQDGDLRVVTYNYTENAGVTLTDGLQTISHSILRPDEYFFDFIPGPDSTGGEQISYAPQRGNAGDIRWTGMHDSLVFVTHQLSESGDQSKSALYLYDGSNLVSLYNFPTKQEIDPVFLNGAFVAPPQPGYITTSVSALNFGVHGVPGDSTLSVTFQNPSGKSVDVNSATITGPNASDFSIVSSTKTVPDAALATGDSIGFTIHFTAIDPKHTSTAQLVVKFANSDSTRSVNLTGGSKDTSTAGVSEIAASRMQLTVSPNPFTSTTKITLRASQNGFANFEVRDVLGRLVFATKSEAVSAGETHTVTFDARALDLTAGVYYLSAKVGSAMLSRQIVLVH